ncbi:MAG: hypothetical protein WCQ21_09535, partial [Verrucomicrobiota bacterium]
QSSARLWLRRSLGATLPRAVRLGQQTLLHLKPPGTHRIELPVVAGRAQVLVEPKPRTRRVAYPGTISPAAPSPLP